jgi:DNA-binding NtrC family response regulator
MGLTQMTSDQSDNEPIVTLAELERHYCLVVLKRLGWSVSAAACSLGISRCTLIRKLKRWGYGRPDHQIAVCAECNSNAPDHVCPKAEVER